MKKFRSFFLITAAVLLTSVCAAAAPRPGDLTAVLVNSGDWGAFGIRDVQALMNKPADALMARALKMLPAEQVKKYADIAAAVDMRVGLSEDDDKVALAVETKRAVTAEDLADLPGFKAGEFSVTAPEGTVITSVGTVDAEDNPQKLIYLANLERDGAKYLIGASPDPANLAVMAAAAENNSLVTSHTPANLWLQIQVSPQTLANEGAPISLPFSVEIGLEDTPSSAKAIVQTNVVDKLEGKLKKDLRSLFNGGAASKAPLTMGASPSSVKVIVWTNIVDELGAMLNKDLRSLFNGGAASKAPLTMGASPLAGLLNISASFLPENFKLSDLIDNADTVKEIEENITAALAVTGLEWNDLLKILRGNVTLGIAGNLEAPVVGTIPGLYLHLSGMDPAKAAPLVSMLSEQIKGLGGEPADYDANGWKGSTFSAPVSLLLAQGEKGMILAGMNADNFAQTPKIAPALASTAEPHNFALALDVKVLQPVLKTLFNRFGETIADEGSKSTVSMVLDKLSMLSALSLVNTDADTFVLEVTPDPSMIDMFLPAAQ